MAERVRVQVLFSEDIPGKGKFQDALYYTQDEYKNTSQADVDKEKKKRKDNWLEIASTDNYEEIVVPIAEQRAQLQLEIDRLETQKAELGS